LSVKYNKTRSRPPKNSNFNVMFTLRTLTEKSILGFGMFSDLKVGNLIRANPQYLIWAYFHIEWINYSVGVRKVLGLEGHEIGKPGIDYEYYDANRMLLKCYTPSKKRHGKANVEVLSKVQLRDKQRIGTKSVVE